MVRPLNGGQAGHPRQGGKRADQSHSRVGLRDQDESKVSADSRLWSLLRFRPCRQLLLGLVVGAPSPADNPDWSSLESDLADRAGLRLFLGSRARSHLNITGHLVSVRFGHVWHSLGSHGSWAT